MKYLVILFLIVYWGNNVYAQTNNNTLSGKVSYVSSQNIYVKFASTKGINIGDTLFLSKNNKLIPVLVVTNLSSTSCICSSLTNIDFGNIPQIIAINKSTETNKEPVNATETKEIKKEKILLPNDTSLKKEPDQNKLKQKIRGSISAASYSYFSNANAINTNRYQYTLSLNAQNIAHSKLSAESYVSFRHEDNKWNVVKDNIYQALKIYTLSLNYDLNKNTRFTLGRKINSKISNMGAIDGLQFDKKIKNFSLGLIAGSRPNYTDYSFDFKLPQFGMYISHDIKTSTGQMQNSVAIVEQMNTTKTDRRFVYLQHTNSIVKNLYLYGTVELDLYKKTGDKPENTLTLSSTYATLSYKMFNKLTLSASYDSRKNVIYYETYKNFINQILETEARQGVSFQTHYNTRKNLSFGVRTGYRFKNANAGVSKNIYGYINYYNIPVIKTSATIASTFLESDYLSGKILNFNLTKDLFKSQLYSELGYQYVNYMFFGSETALKQNIINLSLSWNIIKNLSVSLNFEQTIEKQSQLSRLNIQLRKRF